uniref:G-protein coupled receptors family 1 profile domain-containing protein n=1 Tax=Plectus sambesii TaxID=2011161 RepID=A0A914URT6_9BILA
MAATVTNYVLYGMYAAEGLGITIGNGLLLATIIMEKSLRNRKEMQIIATLCIADLVYGFAGFIMNFYRVLLMAIGLSLQESNVWDCIKWPHSFLQQLGGQLTAYMNLAVGIDRFISITFPIAYYKFGPRYASGFIASFFIYFATTCCVLLSTAYYYTLQNPVANFNLLCLGAPYAPGYVIYHYTFVPVAGALQVIFTIGIFVSYKWRDKLAKSNKATVRSTGAEEQHIKIQRRLTVTLGLITISTVLFFITPFSILAFIFFTGITVPAVLTIILAMSCRVSAIANIIIYVSRQKEVRPGMWKILTCNFKKAANSAHPSRA